MSVHTDAVVESKHDTKADQHTEQGVLEWLAQAHEAHKELLHPPCTCIAEANAGGGQGDGVKDGGEHPQSPCGRGADNPLRQSQLAISGESLGHVLGTANLHRRCSQIGALAFGIGMCFLLHVFEGGLWAAMPLMLAGALLMIPAYPIYKRIARKTKEELTPEILRLSEEIINS